MKKIKEEGEQMTDEKGELFRVIVGLINAANNLMGAILNEDEESISHWNKSIENWRVHQQKDKKISEGKKREKYILKKEREK